MVWTREENGCVYRVGRSVLISEVSGGWVRGGPRLGSMDAVNLGGLGQQRDDG